VVETEGDVGADGVLVERRLLLDEGHVLAVEVGGQVFDVGRVEEDGAGGGVVEAFEEGNEGALAAA
jgi:hypothetical protein